MCDICIISEENIATVYYFNTVDLKFTSFNFLNKFTYIESSTAIWSLKLKYFDILLFLVYLQNIKIDINLRVLIYFPDSYGSLKRYVLSIFVTLVLHYLVGRMRLNYSFFNQLIPIKKGIIYKNFNFLTQILYSYIILVHSIFSGETRFTNLAK